MMRLISQVNAILLVPQDDDTMRKSCLQIQRILNEPLCSRAIIALVNPGEDNKTIAGMLDQIVDEMEHASTEGRVKALSALQDTFTPTFTDALVKEAAKDL